MAEEKKSSKTPLILILLAGCGCLVLISCACIGFFGYVMGTDEFKTEYCNSLYEQDFDLDEDPFGICN